MLEDIYLEYMVKKKKTAAQTALTALVCVLGVVLSFALLVFTFMISVSMQQAGTAIGQIASFIGLLLIAAVWYCVYLLITMQNIEYEYILTNSELDIDKVMSKKGRKHIISIDFKNIVVCAPVEDNEHNNDYRNIKADKVYNVVGDASRGSIYFVDVMGDNGTRTRILFQPTSKMITSANKFNPRNIFAED